MFPALTRALRTTSISSPHLSSIASISNFETLKSTALRTRAKMSTPTKPVQYEWLCVMPDQADALPRRLAVRENHLVHMKSLSDGGKVSYGGIMLARPTLPSETPIPFAGSALILLASSKEEAIATLKADPYSAGNVWDWDRAEIYPFRTALRGPVPSS
ncbi:hypothetical protein EV426DRAFT_618722 [Tirmania nivea]|nr:hypothetical protein EV426DRAFT_618722 [Tirmania nivea]